MIPWKTYHLAQTVTDALETLALAPGSARVIAGGTDLLLDLQQGRHPPVDTLVDVTQIPEMVAVEIRRPNLLPEGTGPVEALFIGAAAPLNRIVASPLVRRHAHALVEACGLIGGPQVRNTATLGGNVSHALPAADGTIALLALEANAEVASREGRRLVPLDELFLGPGRSALRPGMELLVGFYLPMRRPHQGSAFRRVMRPQGVAIAILNLAVWLQRREEQIEDIRISVGPAGPRPLRACQAEDVLRGRSLNEESLALAQEALLDAASFRTSPHRATSEYRQHMAGVLLEEVVAEAWKRAEKE